MKGFVDWLLLLGLDLLGGVLFAGIWRRGDGAGLGGKRGGLALIGFGGGVWETEYMLAGAVTGEGVLGRQW